MNAKVKGKIVLDCLMLLLLPVLMAYSLVGEQAHEWLGALMFLLFIGHHLLNIKWYRGLMRGKWTAARVCQTAVDLCLLLCMLGLMVSGVMLSRYVFDFLLIKGGRSFARTLHMLASYWGFCLMSLHLGMHGNMILGIMRRVLKKRKSAQKTIWPRLAAVLVVGYGVYAFFHRQIGTYLLLKSHFVFFNFDEPMILFFLDYLAVIGFFAVTGCYGMGILTYRRTRSPLSYLHQNSS